jgi:hypothetical protein
MTEREASSSPAETTPDPRARLHVGEDTNFLTGPIGSGGLCQKRR